MNFNEAKHSYTDLIDNSIKFSGKNVRYFNDLKADIICNTIKNNFAHLSKPSVLDIGCGHGLIHKKLCQLDLELVGVDTAAEVLEIAKTVNPIVTYKSYDGQLLPFQDASFDIAFAICVMHHVPPKQWQQFLIEMKRVLRPNGIAIIMEHNPYNPITRYIVANNVLDAEAVLLSSSRVKKLMSQAGFVSIENRYMFFTPFAAKLFRWLDRILWWLPMGAQYFSLAKN